MSAVKEVFEQTGGLIITDAVYPGEPGDAEAKCFRRIMQSFNQHLPEILEINQPLVLMLDKAADLTDGSTKYALKVMRLAPEPVGP